MTSITNANISSTTASPQPDPSKIPPNLPSAVEKKSINANGVKLLQNYINGQFENIQEDDAIEKLIENRNPATNEVLCYLPASQDAQVARAAKAAFEAHKKGEWRRMTQHERSKKLNQIADAIEERFEEMARTESADIGKPVSLARNVDIDRAVRNFRFFAGAIVHTRTDFHDMGLESGFNYTQRRPIGVVGIIKAWNLSIYLLTWAIAPALACGNCVVVKSSELTPMTASILAEIIDKVGLPKGTFNLVHGYGKDVGAFIVEHPLIRCISFTGGTVTGRIVGSVAGRLIKKCSLELGGKNSMLVFDDCDLEKATDLAKRAAFANQGQICLCCSRILIHESIYDRFVERFLEKVRQIRVGDPSDENTTMGALVSLPHREKVKYYIDLAKSEGGQILHGGKAPENLPEKCKEGAFLEPTVIGGLSPTSRTATEEIFGPVVTLHRFSTDEEARDYANVVEYGLCCSLQTSNLNRAHRIADQLETGMVWINTWLLRDLRVPFGGAKNSGIGREGGEESLSFFSEDKNICVAY